MFGLESWRDRHGMSGGRADRDAELVAEGEEPWGDDPPFHVSVFVLTHERKEEA
jgi:hypothetical protein